jgi:hypothetical protein
MLKCDHCNKSFKTGSGKSSLQRHKAAVKANTTRKSPPKSNNKTRKSKTSKELGEKAHRETIKPSHDIFESKKQKEFPNNSVTQSIGVPDVIVYGKGTKFYEIKPNRVVENGRSKLLGSKNRRYLSKDQETTIKRLLKEKHRVFIVYYNKYKRKSGDRFVYQEKELDLENLKRFCVHSSDEKKFLADELFSKY